METRIWISEIEFNDNTKINFDKDDITVFVGPNNSGKSASLKDAEKLLHSKNNKAIVLKTLNIEKEGEEADFLSFIELHSTKEFRSNPEPYYRGYLFDIYMGNLKNQWSNYKSGLNELFPIFVNILSTDTRLIAANPAPSIKITSQAPNHPIHFLQKDDEKEIKFSNLFKQAFGTDLVVHRNAGSEVPLYVGERPKPKYGDDRLSLNYLIELEKLDLLQFQGDGMRSFVGVLLNAFISSHSILLIDEPEAFLHPPQAQLMGKMIARDLPPKRQLFLATHSEDLLKGLLDVAESNLNIIRIQRVGSINKVNRLGSSEIRDIWSDPILRHSNVLDGLFHSKVIICESDSDCRFYQAILFAIHDDIESIIPDEILFLQCGGKDRMPTVIKALKKLNVDVRAIADFDVLNGADTLKRIYEELGGTWTTIESDCRLVKTSIDSKRPDLDAAELKEEIDIILDSGERVVAEETISEIKKKLKKASPWSIAKENGKSYVPNGNPSTAYNNVQKELKDKGLYIVEVGQLESFCKTVGNHGPKFVIEVMTRDLKHDPELKVAREFIKDVVS